MKFVVEAIRKRPGMASYAVPVGYVEAPSRMEALDKIGGKVLMPEMRFSLFTDSWVEIQLAPVEELTSAGMLYDCIREKLDELKKFVVEV